MCDSKSKFTSSQRVKAMCLFLIMFLKMIRWRKGYFWGENEAPKL